MSPPTNSRKRPAPGSSPAVSQQQMAQGFGTPNQLSNDQYLRWEQVGENDSFSDPAQYPINNAMNMQAFGANNASSAQYPQGVPTNTQLARRPMSRQLVTAPRAGYDNVNDPWGPFGDDMSLDPQTSNGMMEENDSVERLEERAVVAKRDAQSKRKQIPPFVQKLSSFLDKSENTDLIRWSDRGDSFVVLDEDEFAKTLIPELFKHNNYASFVRQLNMYGFHKRVGLSDNSMKASERKNKSPSEYYNPYFRRGHPNLLWLINKPKGGNGTKKGKARQKTEDGEGSDEDGQDGVEESYGYGQAPGQGQRAISAAPEAGPLQRREMAMVQNQLQEIQKQQSAISNAISRLRKDHNQLYQQAVAFQTLHDRHESSINAILTFLATVYNRSLDGQNGPNIAQMFANAIPQDQHQGNVVDMSDINDPQHQPQSGNLSPHKRAQRLLMAPPGQRGSMSTASSTQSPMVQGQYSGPNSARPAIEELFENSPADSPQIKTEMDQPPTQHNMMNIINNTNAQSRRPGSNGNGMAFPDALSHFETANGNSPLTSEQRQDMLQLIANSSTGAGSNNALISPSPPMQPTLEDLGYTQAEIDELARMQRDQASKINDVSALIQPLSPSGSIPGLNDGQYFADATAPSPSASQNLDLDQFLDSSAYYPNGDGDYNYDGFGNANIPDASNFDFGLDGTNDGLSAPQGDSGRIVETRESSEAATPEGLEVPEPVATVGQRSPSKRRKRA